jgi:multiple sugar transport system permease protein
MVKRHSMRRDVIGWLFVAPLVLGLLVFLVYPFAASLYWSGTRYDLISAPRWIGGENYRRLAEEVAQGRGFGAALRNTAYYALIATPLTIALGIGLALMLRPAIPGRAAWRTIFYLPSVIPVVATSVLWLWLLDPQDGMINYLLSWVGVPPQNWLSQTTSAVSWEGLSRLPRWLGGDGSLALMGSKDALVLVTLWGVGNWMIIYLAALGDVPQSLYDAAKLDGAGPLRRLWHITLPMLTPVILFNLVMGLVRSVQTFTTVYILSEGTGQPDESLLLVSLHLFIAAFVDLRMGYASAVAWVLLVLLVLATIAIVRTSRWWVYYRFDR